MTTTLPFGRSALRRALLASLAPLAMIVGAGTAAAACNGSAPNKADILQANNNTVTEGGLVQLNVKTSSSNGNVFTWSYVSGPPVVPDPTTGLSTSFTAPPIVGAHSAVLVMRLTASGCVGNNNSAPSSADITINIAESSNANPVAYATTATPSVSAGANVVLSSSGSYDPENDPITYSWTQILGAPTVTIVGANTPTASFVAPAVAATTTFRFRLTVTENVPTALAATATVDVNVVVLNQPPVAAIGCPSTVNEGEQITLDGSGSSDPDNDTLVFEFDQRSGFPLAVLPPLPHDNSISFTAPSLGYQETGMVSFGLTVTDPDNASDSTDDIECAFFIKDVSAPVLSGNVDIFEEAISPSGAPATYSVSALDNVDGLSDAICVPVSGSTFELGETTVYCSKSDSAVPANTGYADFKVTVVDTTAPVIDSHGDVTEEATSAAGAIVDYTSPATSDAYDGNGIANCEPASGTQFPFTGYLAGTLVTCSATDTNDNVATPTTFNVFVVDSTPPTLSLPADITAEATSGAGAAVSFTATASDLVDGDVAVACTPESGSTFVLGTTVVDCSATDDAGNPASGSFNVTVVDTTPPTLSLPADITAEATSGAGAAVSFTATATDIVDGSVAVNCTPASGSTFALGTTAVDCSATDAAGNDASGSFNVTVVDTTPPTLSLPADITEEATSGAGAVVGFTATASDLVDGNVPVVCTPASGSTFSLGTTLVSCEATDNAGNPSSGSFNVTVEDTTDPVIAFHADVNALATSASGAIVSYTLPTASDLVDGSVAVTCAPVSGSTFAVGTTEVNCSATDAAGNTGTSTFNVIVSYNFTGFFKPIDNLSIVNVVKAGQAIPVKFSLGGNMGLAIMAAGYPRSVGMVCSGSLQDAVEETVTAGGSSLSYDPTTGQYIYVWKSEKSWAGTCRQLQVKLADGTSHNANFSFTR